MDSASPEFPMASSMSPLRPSTPKPQTSYNMLPLPRRFAVIRMDPVAMVEHLKLDAKAMAEARAMCPKKFLIYIDTVDELPMPSSEFCRYSVVPIATELRPADPSRGIEPDMVMPIHPNTNHLGDRLPLETTPPFPFPNCYFWYKSDITVRFRARRELIHWYHNGGAYTLPMSAHGRFWGSCFIDIIHRLDDFHATRSQASNDTSMRNMAFGLSHTMIGGNAPESTLVVTPPLRNIYDLLVPAFDTQNSDIETNLKDYFLSLGNSEMGDIETDDPSDKLPPDNFMNTTIDMDLFGWGADPHIPFIPIVDLWFELEEHLSPDTIDPVLPTCGGSRMKLECRIIQSTINRGCFREMPQLTGHGHGPAPSGSRPLPPAPQVPRPRTHSQPPFSKEREKPPATQLVKVAASRSQPDVTRVDLASSPSSTKNGPSNSSSGQAPTRSSTSGRASFADLLRNKPSIPVEPVAWYRAPSSYSRAVGTTSAASTGQKHVASSSPPTMPSRMPPKVKSDWRDRSSS